MAIDTPARVAILGAGPIGLEAALYARFLGYDVAVFERGRVAEHVRRWGHVQMFTPFGRLRTSLGLSALAAQESGYRAPDDNRRLTGNEWADWYLEPLSQTDLLADHIQTGISVVEVSRPNHTRDEGTWVERHNELFQILVRNEQGHESVELAHAVIDATGVYGQSRSMGGTDTPATGELACRERIEWGLPDVRARERAHYAGRRILLVGGGCAGATTALALHELATEAPGTHVTWITRRARAAETAGPVPLHPSDLDPGRRTLVEAANRLALAGSPAFEYRGNCTVDSVQWDAASNVFRVQLAPSDASGRPPHVSQSESFDRIIGHVGYRPDDRLFDALRVERTWATGLLRRTRDYADVSPEAVELDAALNAAVPLAGGEPDFYVLGAKSHGREPEFRMATGYQQIRALFAVLGDRPNLDLYAAPLPG